MRMTESQLETVEALAEQIARVVAERQALRAAGADKDALERNRLELASLQRLFADALVARHLPSAAAA